jgi:hypothetical protein
MNIFLAILIFVEASFFIYFLGQANLGFKVNNYGSSGLSLEYSWAVFTFSPILQNGQHFSSHQILRHMHKILNIDKK